MPDVVQPSGAAAATASTGAAQVTPVIRPDTTFVEVSRMRSRYARRRSRGHAAGARLRHDQPVDDGRETTLAVAVGGTQIVVGLAPPDILGIYRQHADLVEDFADPGGGYLFVAVDDGGDWPRLVVTQRYAPSGPGFTPGVLFVPGHRQVFIGAGTRLLAYTARSGRWRRCWQDSAEFGFRGWRQHRDVVLMSAELELAAWRTDGTKLWTIFVEPPWSYEVVGDRIVLDVMGVVRTLDLRSGR